MFHEASFDLSAAPKGGKSAPAIDPVIRKTLETIVTDSFYEDDIGGQRVNEKWLREMRTKIVDREIWVTAQQLVDAGSGVVDALVPTAAVPDGRTIPLSPEIVRLARTRLR
jgi:hypothetical protein